MSKKKGRPDSALERELQAQKEEEERLRLEAEREAAIAAELKAKQQERLGRRNAEVAEVVNFLQSQEKELAIAEATRAAEQEWSQFTACNDIPEPHDTCAINTYISMLKDDEIPWKTESDREIFFNKLSECEYLASSIREYAEKQCDENNYNESIKLQAKAQEVYDVLIEKLDHFTACILQYPETFLEKTGDILFIEKMKTVRCFLWGNLTQDPARTEIVFKTKQDVEQEAKEKAEAEAAEQAALEAAKKGKKKSSATKEEEKTEAPKKAPYPSTSVSKGLASADTALRILDMRNNPYNKGPSFIAIARSADDLEKAMVTAQEAEELEIKTKEEDERKAKELADNPPPPEQEAEDGSAEKENKGEVTDKPKSAKTPDAKNIPANNQENKNEEPGAGTQEGDETNEDKQEKENSEEENKNENENENENNTNSTKKEENPPEDVIIDMKEYSLLGGVVVVDMFKTMEPPVKIKSWTMRKLSSESVPTGQSYPTEGAPRVVLPDGTEYDATAGKPPWDGLRICMHAYEPPIVDLLRSGDITPQLAWWDKKHNVWRSDGFSDVTVDRDLNFIYFTTSNIAPISVITKRNRFFTIDDWELAPSSDSPGVATLSLLRALPKKVESEDENDEEEKENEDENEGDEDAVPDDLDDLLDEPTFEMSEYITTTIAINTDGTLCLQGPDFPQLQHLLNKPMQFLPFTQALQRSGYNIFPGLKVFADNGLENGPAPEHIEKQNLEDEPTQDETNAKEGTEAANNEGEDQETDKGPKIKIKNESIEEVLYQMCSLLCAAYHIKESVWNSESCDSEDFALRIKPSANNKKKQEWVTFLMTGLRRAYEAQVQEHSDEFQDDIALGEVKEYNTLYHAVVRSHFEHMEPEQPKPEESEGQTTSTTDQETEAATPTEEELAEQERLEKEKQQQKEAERKQKEKQYEEDAKLLRPPAPQAQAVARLLNAVRPIQFSTGYGPKEYRESERDRIAKELAEKARLEAEAEKARQAEIAAKVAAEKAAKAAARKAGKK
eukprot:m.234244 g.234244  ORF g.234244 m.234244 type:complete len:1015 (-) comp16036_c0_seq3:32-3076(-)